MVGGYLHGIGDAAAAARDYNERLRRVDSGVALVPTAKGAGLVVRLDWGG